MIKLDDKSYIVGMWFSSNKFTNNDWMGCVIKDPNREGHFKGWSRFRYGKDKKIWNSKDEKSWTAFQTDEKKTEDEAIEIFNTLQEHIKAGYPDTDKIIVKGSLEDLIKASKEHSWLNMKMVDAKND